MKDVQGSKIKEINAKKVLILTASGGGGLLIAAKAKEQEALKKNPKVEIQTVDLLKMSLVGSAGVKFYNSLQRKGSIQFLENLVGLQRNFERVFWPKTFFFVLRSLFKNNVDHIIDTQPLVPSAVIKAIRIYNKIKKKNVILEKVIVDFPNVLCYHFFRNIKKLSNQDRENMYLVSLMPLLKSKETAKQFWQTHCKMPLEKVSYEKYPIRQGFIPYQDKVLEKKSYSLKIRINDTKEKKLLQSVFKKMKTKISSRKDGIAIKVEPQDKVLTVLLGTQPAFLSTMEYIQNFLELVKDLPQNKKYFLFVYCDNSEHKNKTLMEEVCVYLKKYSKMPPHAIVIPFSFQKEDIIAPLFFRSDVTITRSGGQTLIELMRVSKASVFIHSEKKQQKQNPTQEELFKGIADWEGGNVRYVQKYHGCNIITTSLFKGFCKALFLQ